MAWNRGYDRQRELFSDDAGPCEPPRSERSDGGQDSLSHPLSVGTVLTTADGKVVKTVVEAHERDSAGRTVYRTVTVNGNQVTDARQTRHDLSECVRELGWTVQYRPGEAFDHGGEDR